MKMKQAGKVALSSLLGLTLLAGCGGSGESNSGDATKADGSVVVNLASEPPQMVSFLTTDSTAGNVMRHCIEGLTKLDENDKPVEGMAQSWTVSDDGLTYTFKLRDGIKWSNGDPVTAHDFEFAWDSMFTTTNGAQYASTWATYVQGAQELMQATKKGTEGADAAFAAKGWKAVDDTTFEATFTAPYPYILDLMAFYSFAPVNEKFYNEQGGAIGDKGSYGKDADTMLYNGPFKITSWAHEDSLILEKNPDYYGADAIKLNKIEFKMIDNTSTAKNGYENGDLDMIGLTGEQAKEYREAGKDVQNYFDGGVWYFEFNTTKKPFNNPKVRKALTLGINVDQYIENIVMNNSEAGQALTTPAVRNGEFNKAVGTLFNRYTTDFSEPKAMLEEGLAEEGMTLADFSLELLGDEGDNPQKNYAFFQNQWQTNLGIPKVDIKQVQFKTRLDLMSKTEFDVVFAGWSLDYNDPMTYLDIPLTDGGNNHGKYSNPEYDELIRAAYTEGDSAKRDEMLIKAEKILAEDMPMGVVYYRSRDYITSPRLKGVQRTAFRDIDLRFAETVAE